MNKAYKILGKHQDTDVGLGEDFLDMTPKSILIKENNKLGFIQIKKNNAFQKTPLKKCHELGKSI